MKSRPTSSSAFPRFVRRFKVEADLKENLTTKNSPESLQNTGNIRIEELPPIPMNGLQPFSTPPSGALLTPIQGGFRRTVSGDQAHNVSRENSPIPATPAGSEGGEWSSAVGYASTSGKSGRVIEKLMSEKDRLQRDLNQQVIRSDELQKTLQMYQPQIEALKAENDNLTHARGVDSALLSRRDRKIEELKSDLQQERKRRESMEQRVRQMERERDEAVESKAREVQLLTEKTKHATVHADIMESSHKQLAGEYRARIEATRKDLSQLQDERERDRQTIAKLDVVSEQMRQELERNRKVQAEFVAKWEELHRSTDQIMVTLDSQTQIETERMRNFSNEMESVVKEMKWLIGVKKALRTDSKSNLT